MPINNIKIPQLLIYERRGNQILNISNDTKLFNLKYYPDGILKIDKIISNEECIIDTSIRKTNIWGENADSKAYYFMKNLAFYYGANFVDLHYSKSFHSMFEGNFRIYRLDEDKFNQINSIEQTIEKNLICDLSSCLNNPRLNRFESLNAYSSILMQKVYKGFIASL